MKGFLRNTCDNSQQRRTCFLDQLVMWLKPQTCPSWLTRETLAALSDSLVLREVRYRLGTSGFRTREITLVTTLLDAETYGVSDLAELYRQRWQVETALSHLKTAMQMDVLHCKTVPGVLKELMDRMLGVTRPGQLSLFRQGLMLFELIPKMREDRLRALAKKFGELLQEHALFTGILGVI
jgi:Transposase DDE domain